MRYREMVKNVQRYSGFSDSESENALVSFIKLVSKRLTPDERMDFASQLPAELQDTVVSIEEPEVNLSMEQMMESLADEQDIDEDQAKEQLLAVWRTIRDAITNGEIDDIRSQLPSEMTTHLS